MDMWNKAMNDIETENNFKEFMEGLPNYIKMLGAISKSEKAYYDELVKEGFTEEQALYLVGQHGIYPGRTDLNQNK